jgi:hypothetical protein
MTLDGLDAQTGQPGDCADSRVGDVLEPDGLSVRRGFDWAANEVLGYRFALREQSFAALSGVPVDKVGIVEVCVFSTRPVPAHERRGDSPVAFAEEDQASRVQPLETSVVPAVVAVPRYDQLPSTWSNYTRGAFLYRTVVAYVKYTEKGLEPLGTAPPPPSHPTGHSYPGPTVPEEVGGKTSVPQMAEEAAFKRKVNQGGATT